MKRGNQVINHLSPQKIKVLQREKDLEDYIYNGVKSINIILDDIRICDIIEYSYTLKEKNIQGKDLFYTRVFFTTSTPVSFFRYRLLWPKERPISLKHRGDNLKPKIKHHNQYKEYLWTRHHLGGFEWEPQTPISFDCRDFIEISDKSTWFNVNTAIAPLYRNQMPLSSDLQQYIANISASTSDKGKQFITVMRFVQDKVRYMGMPDRVDAHQPAEASLTFSQRYGDCKDKTLLALTILRALKIEAYPALVHTNNGDLLNTRLPNSSIFNHVIIVAIIKGKKYWIDPTQSLQGGLIHNYSQPYYGYSLVVDGKSRSLIKMPRSAQKKPNVEILEVLDVSKGPNHSSSFTVTTLLRGVNADDQRGYFLRTSKKEIQKKYLNYFQALYPELHENREIEIIDDRKKNHIKIIESYSIPNIWKRNETKKSWFITLFQKDLYNYLDDKDISSSRMMPLSIGFPRHLSKRIEVHLPQKKWQLSPSFFEVSDSAFDFSQRETYKDHKFTVTTVYKSLKNSIEAVKVKSYIKNINNASDELNFSLHHYDLDEKVDIEDSDPSVKNDTLNWSVLIIMVITFVFFTFLSIKIYQYNPIAQPSIEENNSLKGIGGWLILLSVGVLISPLVTLKEFWELAEPALSYNRWLILADPAQETFNPVAAPFLLFANIVNEALFIFFVLAVFLFFRKKKIFPQLYMYLLLGDFLFFIIDHLIFVYIYSEQPTGIERSQIVKYAISTLIWCTYLLKSKRVKSTFVN